MAPKLQLFGRCYADTLSFQTDVLHTVRPCYNDISHNDIPVRGRLIWVVKDDPLTEKKDL